MANWEALKSYVTSNYKILEDKGQMVSLVFNLDGGRHQTVIVSRSGEVAGNEWAEVSTAVAKESQVNLRDLLVRNNDLVAGGLSILELPGDQENLVVFGHSFPLADLDPREFEDPLQICVLFGDMLEKELTGGDTF
jgi:hypothetical protein